MNSSKRVRDLRIFVAIGLLAPCLVAPMVVGLDLLRFAHACSANGYSNTKYLAYCEHDVFGDYEHGALYLEIEPESVRALRAAEILFLGNSRLQVAFSTNATRNFFSSQFPQTSYFLLGFAFSEGFVFPLKLIQKLKLRPKVLIVNVDDQFLDYSLSEPARTVIFTAGALQNYEMKRNAQAMHSTLCNAILAHTPWPCGTRNAIFREMGNGMWDTENFFALRRIAFQSKPGVNFSKLSSMLENLRLLVDQSGLPPECIVVTTVPIPEWGQDTARELARLAGLPSATVPSGTWDSVDGNHLHRDSAEKWSAQMLNTASANIRGCLDRKRNN